MVGFYKFIIKERVGGFVCVMKFLRLKKIYRIVFIIYSRTISICKNNNHFLRLIRLQFIWPVKWSKQAYVKHKNELRKQPGFSVGPRDSPKNPQAQTWNYKKTGIQATKQINAASFT